MIWAGLVMAFAAGLLIGAAVAYDKGFIAGRRWGYQLGAEKREGDDIMARIQRLL